MPTVFHCGRPSSHQRARASPPAITSSRLIAYGRAKRLKNTCSGETASNQASEVPAARPTHLRSISGSTSSETIPASSTGRRIHISDSPTVSATTLS